MLKHIVCSALLSVSIGASAQLLGDAYLSADNETLNIFYTPGKDGAVKLLMSQDGGEWVELHNFTNSPDGKITWNVFVDYPEGIKNARFRVSAYSLEDISKIPSLPSGLRALPSERVVHGNFAYFLEEDKTSRYGGDLRKGTAATSTQQVTVTANVYIYDFVSQKWTRISNVASESVRVPKHTHNGLFPAPRIPSYSIWVAPDGTVKVGGKQVSNDKLDAYSISQPLTIRPRFSTFAKNYVEKKIDAWQIKGEFEKTSDYRNRILSERDNRIAQYTEEAKQLFINSQKPADLRASMTLGRYDSDNEVFLISTPQYGDMFVPVPVKDAPKFKKDWLKVAAIPAYAIENDELILAGVAFRPNKGKAKQAYYYKRGSATEYSIPEIAFNFKPIEIDAPEASDSGNTPGSTIRHEKVVVGNISDVDTDIPEGNKTANTNTFAVIISNENYRRVASVEYALNDGRSVANYLRRTLGLSDKHIHHIEDATLNDIRNEIDWMKSVGKAYNGDASFIVYYAGHGLPDDANQNGYLLPVDGYGSNVSTALSMNDLANELGAIDSKITLVLLDACFSGAVRSGAMLSSERGVALKVKPHNVNRGNVVMISASQEDQTASKYDEQGHGLFTYFLLKSLQDTKGRVTIGQLVEDVTNNVNRISVVANNKSQRPAVTASPSISTDWHSIRISELSKF